MRLDGVLFFPVTPFGADGELAEQVLARHVADGVAAGAGGVFTACGTGEFNALDLGEYSRAVATSVAATERRVPVFAGAGGTLPAAKAIARAAAAQGADGLLLMPPYLVTGPAAGLVRYVREVAESVELPIIIYQRGTARFTPEAVASLAQLPNVVGFKDGLGDFDLLQRIILTVRQSTDKEFTFFNGLPTAEFTVPAYRGMGVNLYSSAVFAFAPEIALAFHKAVTGGDEVLVQRLLTGFYLPLVELRDLVPGYAVSLVKAGVRMRGLDAGGVRAPLVDPEPEHLATLEQIIATGLEIAGA
ncbi:5-dehydro-4-deoxyglucarate dehydratase [Nonomuraea turkmeniaca]|uniref:Probable 5-dehydro-4-deoxyglucarate dehydratase n=1 Tax=Nonomuraea turkmeniaca TaxID=103838 RepID=A0A5S4FGD8_9ACTN|nr:5-dehydro-4-deoxyglucarate dehydratase [Nonomuraea turkmeniaca]TMR08023.1 5-dehydro-4-deoxyglucarate dehydratase [Nonomuraea turkmeniaca]